MVCIYEDDLIFTGNSLKIIEAFKVSMKNEFDMTDMGMLHYFLRIEVRKTTNSFSITQQKYTREILDNFNMGEAVPMATPMEFRLKLSKDSSEECVNPRLYISMVGSLMYLTTTRSNIMLVRLLVLWKNPRRAIGRLVKGFYNS